MDLDDGFIGSANGVSKLVAMRSRIETNHERGSHARRRDGRSSLVNLVARFVGFG
jgi:hypothetical protein